MKREETIVKIGGKEFKSPKNIDGTFITIGAFCINQEQTDEEFLKIIHKNNPIKFRSFG